MALTQQQKRELIRKARSGETSAPVKKPIKTVSQSIVKSQQAKSDIRSGVTAVRQFQSELIAKARAEQEGRTPPAPKESVIRMPQESDKSTEFGVFERAKILQEKNVGTRQFLREKTPIGKLFFGNSDAEYFGNIERPKDEDEGFFEGLGKDVQSKGVVRGLLYSNILRTPEERLFINSGELRKLGYESGEAEQFSRQFIEGNTENIPAPALSQMQTIENERKAWAFVEMLDAIPVFKAAKARIANPFFRETISKAMLAESAIESRQILVEAIPKLKGTQELEDLISSLRQVADPAKGETLLHQVAVAAKRPVTQSTEAQRVFYQNGIPIVRGGDIASETVRRGVIDVPSQTKDALALRKEINDVLAGQAEQARLSNLDVFADEIKAGALPFKAVPEDKVKMFISDAVADATKLRPGDRLATAKEVLEETLEKGKAKVIEVMPKDLVRLADGTFVYAPKESLGKGVQATLRSLRASQQAKVAKIERQKTVSQLRKQIANEADVFNTQLAKREAAKTQAREQLSREIAEEADFFNKTLARREMAEQATRTLAEQGERTKRVISEITESTKTKAREIREKAKALSQSIKTAAQKVDSLKKVIGETPKLIAKERAKAREAIKKINSLKRISVKEKAKRRAQVIKNRDKEIARLTKEKTKLQASVPKARVELTKLQEQVIDKDSAIAKLEQQALIQKASLRADSKTALASAEATLKEVSKPLPEPKVTTTPKPQTPVQKARVKNTEEVATLTASIKESFSITAKTIPESISSPINPVKGEGKTVESQIIKGLQDEIEVIKKNFEERGLSLADLPDTHQAIGNDALMKQAFADLVADPAKVYSDFISGVLPDGTTRAAYALALMKSDFVLQNPARMDMVARAFYKGNTRIGQELQSIKVFGRMDYLNIVGRFSKQADDILKARGVDVEKEAAKLLKQFGDEFDSLAVASKDDMVQALNSITCKV